MNIGESKAIESLLIRACIAPEGEFEARFRAFDSQTSLDGLNDGAMRLIPYLYRRLEGSRIQSSHMPIYKGVYTKYWYLHHMYRARATEVCENILADIPFLLLKGHALQHTVYSGEAALRPCDDIDVLVPTALRKQALARFLSRGFRIQDPRLIREILWVHPSVSLALDSVEVDLHWDVRPVFANVETSAILFRDSVSIQTPTGPFLTPSVNHNLAHTLVHGWTDNDVSPIRWVLDSHLLMQDPEFDWVGLATAARELQWIEPVYQQLQTLRSEYGLHVPKDALNGLRTLQSRAELRVLRQHRRPKGTWAQVAGVVTIRRTEQYRSIRKSEKKYDGFSLPISLFLTIYGELYRAGKKLSDGAKPALDTIVGAFKRSEN